MAMNPEEAPATKGDVKSLRGDMNAVKGDVSVLKGDVNLMRGDITSLTRKFALEIVKTNARVEKLGDEIRGEIRAMHSDIVGKIDGFMSNVGKIDRAQIIADWRVTQLEGRVDKIETRPS